MHHSRFDLPPKSRYTKRKGRPMTEPKDTHFGFKTVGWDEKQSHVRSVFDSVASRYDLMNDVMSMGAHRLWKRHMVDSLRLTDGMQVLDLAGGTGDIGFAMRKRAAIHLTICDINAEMLKAGRARGFDKNIRDLNWVCGNAECLPLPDQAFDVVTIAFGIRNVTDIPAALRDMRRVLKPGGRLACLEFSQPTAALRPIYDRYSFSVIPRMGEWITKDRDSYQYLVESIRRFPTQDVFADMIRDAGFSQVRYDNLSAGVVALHTGYKI